MMNTSFYQGIDINLNLFKHNIFKSLKMKKTMNKFDYPTAVSHTYKLYKPENEKQDNTAEQREKFKEIVQREK